MKQHKTLPLLVLLCVLSCFVWGGVSCVVSDVACVKAEDCPAPYRVCINGSCKGCLETSDCGTGLVCFKNVCQKKPQDTPDASVLEAASERINLPDRPSPPERAERPISPEASAPDGSTQERVPESACSGPGCSVCLDDETRKCYPFNDQGCLQKNETWTCRGLCRVGEQRCEKGQWGSCTGAVMSVRELCNEKDDDCDGEVDEDFPNKGKSCTVGWGKCQVQGTFVCGLGRELLCNATPKSPGNRELCGNNTDDDCDGLIDEGCECNSAQSKTCKINIGECQSTGRLGCTNGKFAETCAGWIAPKPDICDGKDNNCDGSIDEGCCRPTKLAYTFKPRPDDQNNPLLNVYYGSRYLSIRYTKNISQAWELTGPTQKLVGENKSATTATAIIGYRHASAIAVKMLGGWRLEVLQGGNKKNVITPHQKTITHLALYEPPGIVKFDASSFQANLVSGDAAGALHFWALQGKEVKAKGKLITAHSGPITDLVIRGKGEWIASASEDGSIKLWKYGQDKAQLTIQTPKNSPVRSVETTANGAFLFGAAADGIVYAWDNKGTQLGAIKPPSAKAFPLKVRFDPRGGWLAIAYSDGTIKTYDVPSYKVVHTLRHSQQPLPFLTISGFRYYGYNDNLQTFLIASDALGHVKVWSCQ